MDTNLIFMYKDFLYISGPQNGGRGGVTNKKNKVQTQFFSKSAPNPNICHEVWILEI
ncbi:unnamed protein product [Meloidogyne enterolobii]|uniref:Uncharacterized protein n=1 Tax=Meloidogyne enterolobii TaxID=390850 RepID=A0ACB0ZD24_MELEN